MTTFSDVVWMDSLSLCRFFKSAVRSVERAGKRHVILLGEGSL